MKKEITAKWARETAENKLSLEADAQLERCEKEIESAVNHNLLSCNCGIFAQRIVIAELTRRGFKCEQHSEQRDGSWLTISW